MIAQIRAKLANTAVASAHQTSAASAFRAMKPRLIANTQNEMAKEKPTAKRVGSAEGKRRARLMVAKVEAGKVAAIVARTRQVASERAVVDRVTSSSKIAK